MKCAKPITTRVYNAKNFNPVTSIRALSIYANTVSINTHKRIHRDVNKRDMNYQLLFHSKRHFG